MRVARWGDGCAAAAHPHTCARIWVALCGLELSLAHAHLRTLTHTFHRSFNLKRKTRGLAPVTSDEFEAIPARERMRFIEDYS